MLRRRYALLAAALLAVTGLALGSVVAGPVADATAAVSAGKPDKPGKPGGGGGGSTELEYAAVGDSFAAGVGARSYLESSCYTSSKSYPKLLDADANLRLIAFLACSGASTATVISAQVPAISATTKRVTLTVGGNDIGFATIMQNCFVFVSSSCLSQIENGEALVANGTVAANIGAAVQAIRAKAPGAKVVVAGYPLLFHEPNTKYQWAARVNQGTVGLNDAIEAAALANGAVFVDVEVAFAGHGVGSASPWINDWAWLRYVDSFHANATGYVAYAAEIRKVIG
jgi:lysophospholipase L1-like esterase